MWTIREISQATAGELVAGNPDEEIAGVSIDSRTIKKGDIFICIRGERFDGHDFIPQAIKNGAAAICFCRDKAAGAGSKIPRNALLPAQTFLYTGDRYNRNKRQDYLQRDARFSVKFQV